MTILTTILFRSARGLASSARHLARFWPKVIPLALVSMIGLAEGRTASVDRDGDGEETARSIVYRHFI
ncbi:hypothetical protein CLBKND_03945 [Methylorubrum aminovorans]